MKLKLVFLLLTLTLAVARAADTSTSDIIIDGGYTTFTPTNGALLVVITNDVRATQGTTVLTCDELSILTTASATNHSAGTSLSTSVSAGSELERIVAAGHVVISDLKGRAYGDRAVYDQATDILTLTAGGAGPRLESADGKDYATASEAILFNRRTGGVLFKGKTHINFSGPLHLLSLPGTSTGK